MDSPTTYLEWGIVLISLPNLLVLVAMVSLFILALVAPFEGTTDVHTQSHRP